MNQRRRLDRGCEKLAGSQGVQWCDEALAAGRAGGHVEECHITHSMTLAGSVRRLSRAGGL